MDVGSFQTSGKDNDHDDWGVPCVIRGNSQLLDVGSFQTSGKDNDHDDWGLPGVIGGAANCWMLVASRLQAKIMTTMIGGCLVLLEEQPTVGCW